MLLLIVADFKASDHYHFQRPIISSFFTCRKSIFIVVGAPAM